LIKPLTARFGGHNERGTKMKNLYRQEIENRGFETSFISGFKGAPSRQDRIEEIGLTESRRGLRLYVADGWKKYSRNCVYPVRLVYLAGVDRGQYWAIRCPASVKTIDQALAYTEPAAAKNARKSGLRVIRQGDVFIIEKKRGKDNLRGLPASHQFNPDTREIIHESHRKISIPFPFRIALGKSLSPEGRGRRGD